MNRRPGLSARLRLTFSYAAVILLAGVLLLVVVWIFALRWIPNDDKRSLLSRVSAGGGTLIITGPTRSELLRGAVPATAIALAALLVLGLLGGWILAGRMLAPLTRIRDATRLAAGGALSHRIALPGRMDEFRELADAFDGMLARLEAHVAEQRRFAANASHELRTPLAITKSLLDVAREDPGGEPGALHERLRAVNARAIDLTEALLLLSRADQRSFRRERVDLSLIAEEATETLVPLAEKHGVSIETNGEMAAAVGSQALLLQLTTNLVHNAIVHNLPGRGTVRVTTSAQPTTAVLTVENTGEKLTPQTLPTLVEPFLRGTERVHTDYAGVGLGLAIVKSITEAHDGTLTLVPRPGGGLRVTVQLPAAPRTGR